MIKVEISSDMSGGDKEEKCLSIMSLFSNSAERVHFHKNAILSSWKI